MKKPQMPNTTGGTLTDAEMQAQASAKLSLALPAETPARIRNREVLWAVLFLLCAWLYLDRDAYRDQLILEERSRQIAKCKAVQDQHARNLTTLLDRGGVLFVGDEVVTTCRRKS